MTALRNAQFNGGAQNHFAKGRLKSGDMNQTEAAYAETLELQKQAGEIIWYRFEAITFKLADDTRYTPDFLVLTAEGYLECRECKGWWQDDAKVKIKVAASIFPLKFVAIHKKPKKDGGGWSIVEF